MSLLNTYSKGFNEVSHLWLKKYQPDVLKNLKLEDSKKDSIT